MAGSLKIQELTAKNALDLNVLVSQAFDYGTEDSVGQSFFDDFPIWDLRNGPNVRCFGVFEDGARLVSHVGIKFWNMRGGAVGASPVKVSAIGAVATHKDFRGRGLSSMLMKHVLEISDAMGAKQCLLWGSEHEFYKRFNFSLQGQQYRFPIGLKNGIGFEGIIPQTGELKSGWNVRMFSEMQRRQWGVAFEQTDLSWIEKQNSVKWFWLDQPFAYVGIGRGRDLPGIIHEFGGDPVSLQRLIQILSGHSGDIEWMIGGEAMRALGAGALSKTVLKCAAPDVSEAFALVRGDWPLTAWFSGLGSV